MEGSALLGELTGVGIYVRELALALSHEMEVRLFLASLKDSIPPWLREECRGPKAPLLLHRRLPARCLLAAWHTLRIPGMEWIAGTGHDLVHSPNYTVLPTRFPLVVTLHDLYFLRNPTAGTEWGGRFFARNLRRHRHRVTRFIAVSELTRRDAIELLGLEPHRVSVVLEAPRQDFLAPVSPEAEEHAWNQLDFPRDYLLSYGNDDPRKNRSGLLAAYKILRQIDPDSPPLVLVGGQPPPTQPGLVWRPYLSAVELRSALQRALLLVYPSHYEGFGLPVAEALALGTPVAAAATGAIPEIARDAYIELDPASAEQMAHALRGLYGDSALLHRLRDLGPRHAAKLSWKRAARETMAVYRAALEDR